MSLSAEFLMDITQDIMGLLGFNTGILSIISKIISGTKRSEEENFKEELKKSIKDYLSNDDVTDDVAENLRKTFKDGFVDDLRTFFNDKDMLCENRTRKYYGDDIDSKSAKAYRTALYGIVGAICTRLEFFGLESAAIYSTWENSSKMKKQLHVIKSLEEVNHKLLLYKGSFAEFVDNTTMPEKSFNRFHFMNPHIKFTGRKDEIALIDEFMTQENRSSDRFNADIHIWSIAGPGGIGKSKFAVHIAERYKGKNWGVVWLKKGDFNKIKHLTNLRDTNQIYRKDVLFICDYADQWQDELMELIENMKSCTLKIHFLLIERSENWFEQFLDGKPDAKYKLPHKEPLNLSDKPLTRTDYDEILDGFAQTEIYVDNNLAMNLDKDKVIAYTESLGEDNRCLFLLLAADACMHRELQDTWSAKELMDNYIKRSKRMFTESYGDNLCSTAYRLLALATAVNGLDAGDTNRSGLVKQDIKALKRSAGSDGKQLKRMLSKLCEKPVTDNIIAALQPDIVGEYLFLDEFCSLIDDSDRRSWLKLLLDSDYFRNTFMLRCLKDWSHTKEMEKLIRNMAYADAVKTAKIIRDYVVSVYRYSMAERPLELLNVVYGIDGCDEVAAYYSRAISHIFRRGNREQQNAMLEVIEHLAENIRDKESKVAAYVYNNLAYAYDNMKDYDNALNIYNKALDIYEKKLEKDDYNLSALYNNIALVYLHKDKYDDALDLFNKALEIEEKALDKDDPDRTFVYSNIAGLYDRIGEYDKALDFYNKALEIDEKVLDKDDPDLSTRYNNIALVYLHKDKYDDALDFLNKALEIDEKVLDKDDLYLAHTYQYISLPYIYNNDYGKARFYLRKALKIFEDRLGNDNQRTIDTKEALEFTEFILAEQKETGKLPLPIA